MKDIERDALRQKKMAITIMIGAPEGAQVEMPGDAPAPAVGEDDMSMSEGDEGADPKMQDTDLSPAPAPHGDALAMGKVQDEIDQDMIPESKLGMAVRAAMAKKKQV